ncbi:MAG: metalloregulator ArsR/SmtB family transcription factor [Pseudomonadota bacterium]
MVESSESRQHVFKALSDPVRRRLLDELRVEPRTIGELAEPLDMTFAGAAKHIAVLEHAKLVRKEKRGREQLCHLDPSPLGEVQLWLDQYQAFWTARLDALAHAIEEDEN